MANLKISQLPEYTGSATGVYLVMNNSGETATYKVTRENIIGSLGSSGSSGTSGSTGTSGSSGSSGTSGTSPSGVATTTVNPDYIQVQKSVNQTGVTKNSDITFDVVTSTNSGITHSNGVFTLTANKTYVLEASLDVTTFSSDAAYLWWSWVDATTNVQLDTSNGGVLATGASGVAVPATWGSNDNYVGYAKLIYKPATNQTIKLRATDGGGTCVIYSIASRATITQINPTVTVNNGSSGTSGTSGSNGSSGSGGTSGTSGTSGVVSYTGLITSGSLGGTQTISGSLNVIGNLNSIASSGDEGGEINLALAQTNNTLTGSVIIDVWRNRLRFFEGSGNARGAYFDVSKLAAGVGSEILTKASGFVNAGDYVILGDLKARIPTSGNRSLQVATISSGVTYSVIGSGTYNQAGSIAGITINSASPLSITTTPTYLNAAAGFVTSGAVDVWTIMDYVNFIAWRISCVIGPSYSANLITIERLY